MNLHYDSFQTKNTARSNLIGNYTVAARACLLVELLETILSLLLLNVQNGLGFVSAFIVSFVCMILTWTLASGYCRIALSIARKSTPEINDLFYAYKNHTDTMIRITAFQLLIAAIWYVPFVLFLTRFITVFVNKRGTAGTILLFILFLLLSLVLLVFILSLELHYIMASFLFVDHPEWKASQLLKESRLMMAGHRKELGILLLSFIGYLALGFLSLGIGMLWVTPYICQTISLCYINWNSRGSDDQYDDTEY